MLIIINSSEGSICVCKKIFKQDMPKTRQHKNNRPPCNVFRRTAALIIVCNVVLTQLLEKLHYACDHASAFSVGVCKACATRQHLVYSPLGKHPARELSSQCNACLTIYFQIFNIRINKISPLYRMFIKTQAMPGDFISIKLQ